ncbi:hypothetical protein SZ00_06268 (plasmid) [Rhodococcus sp. AD45]|nr:hypothetical protein SZ00_06268 [Rhodococcus sp. AD45]
MQKLVFVHELNGEGCSNNALTSPGVPIHVVY